jgi:hypothetical protein
VRAHSALECNCPISSLELRHIQKVRQPSALPQRFCPIKACHLESPVTSASLSCSVLPCCDFMVCLPVDPGLMLSVPYPCVSVLDLFFNFEPLLKDRCDFESETPKIKRLHESIVLTKASLVERPNIRMCNLLVPLCPFVLHSLTTQSHQETGSNPAVDAKILFSYLSKNGYKNSSNQPQPKPLALKTARLYKRTSWHTCPCFFRVVAVLHPLTGPSKARFGFPYQSCARCSGAARVLRPMRLGGIGDGNSKGDQYFNRCIFAAGQEVLEDSSGSDVYSNLTRAPAQARPSGSSSRSQPADRQYQNRCVNESQHDPLDSWEANSHERHREKKSLDNWRSRSNVENVPSELLRRSRTFQSGLDSYLTETYGSPVKGADSRH